MYELYDYYCINFPSHLLFYFCQGLSGAPVFWRDIAAVHPLARIFE